MESSCCESGRRGMCCGGCFGPGGNRQERRRNKKEETRKKEERKKEQGEGTRNKEQGSEKTIFTYCFRVARCVGKKELPFPSYIEESNIGSDFCGMEEVGRADAFFFSNLRAAVDVVFRRPTTKWRLSPLSYV